MSRPYQLVIFGASGFTAKKIIEDLVRFIHRNRYPLKWAVSGRNVDKIKKSMDDASRKTNVDLSKIDIIKANLEDTKSLVNMGRSTSLVMNCTGPFRSTGPPVVDACINSSTDYVDIAGEPQFMEEIQLKYHKIAQQKGIYVVPGSGFDCVPTDCGVNFLKDNFDGNLNYIEIFLSAEQPGIMKGNITTWYSLIDGIADQKNLTKMRKELLKEIFNGATPRPVREKTMPRRGVMQTYCDDYARGYILPFKGADPSVIRRTQMHCELMYGEKPIPVQMYSLQDLRAMLRWAWMGISVSNLATNQLGRRLSLAFPRFFSGGILLPEGPSEEEMNTKRFVLTLKAVGTSNNVGKSTSLALQIRGPHPGYPGCAICVNQATITLLEERDKLPKSGGVYTPGAAFRKTTIIERLSENGLDIKIYS